MPFLINDKGYKFPTDTSYIKKYSIILYGMLLLSYYILL